MKITKTIIVLLMILSTFSGLNFISKNASATVPTLSNYNATPLSFDLGEEPDFYIHFWCTYTDLDNDSPTTMTINRWISPVLSPIKNMIANNTGDTNYADGKQYYYNWIYWDFPFIGVSYMRFGYASNSSGTYTKQISITQIGVAEIFKQSGVSPVNQTTPDNYTFFTQYWSAWDYAPQYVKLVLDNVPYTMNKNNSMDNDPFNGINYTYSINLTAGLHKYSFNTSFASYPSDRSAGNVYILIQNETITNTTDWNLIVISIIIVSLIIAIGAFSFVKTRKKYE
jgi:hypothetical protein